MQLDEESRMKMVGALQAKMTTAKERKNHILLSLLTDASKVSF